MDKNKQDENTSKSAPASAVEPIKPLPKPGKPMRGNFDKEDKSNDQFPSAL
jgi:hypothetical protein